MKIYLASKSKARKKLLTDIFGFKVRVIPTNAKEDKKREGLSYTALVKRNALRKALAAAEKIKSGIIIAADTLTVQNGKIFGKPLHLGHARAMLKRLSNGPQWVYTGIAVIDKGKSKIRTASEKTKVYMDSLSEGEIRAYFRRVSPLDKAGSFDIQGRGAFFMRRIEGCFYNVVGLPLHKLYRILKELGVKVFCVIFAVVFLSGCATEYNLVTKQEEIYIYSTDREVALGQSIVKQVEREYKLCNDPVMRKRVEDIGKKIVAVCDRKDILYSFYILDDEEVNAMSLPGGIIYINRGLIEKVASDDELAGVLAHEVAHIVARHSIKKLQAMQGYSLLSILIAGGTRSGDAAAAADMAFTEIMLGYAREDELLADTLATRYMRLAGYDPHAMINFLDRLNAINKRKPLRAKSYYRTHPYTSDRIRVVREELGENMTFDEYINMQDRAHDNVR